MIKYFIQNLLRLKAHELCYPNFRLEGGLARDLYIYGEQMSDFNRLSRMAEYAEMLEIKLKDATQQRKDVETK